MSDIEFYITLAVQRGERYALEAAVDDLDKLRIEVERLRAGRDALREALQDMVDEFQHMARPGRAYINVDDALQAAGILDKANAALAAVPAPPQTDDRLTVAERVAKTMLSALLQSIPDKYISGWLESQFTDDVVTAIARRTMDDDDHRS